MAKLTKAIDLKTLQDSIQIESILIEKSIQTPELTPSLLKHLDLIFEDTTLENDGVSQYIRNIMGGQSGASIFIPTISK